MEKPPKARAVSCLEKFHEAGMNMRRKTKEMTLARAEGYEEIDVEEGSERLGLADQWRWYLWA